MKNTNSSTKEGHHKRSKRDKNDPIESIKSPTKPPRPSLSNNRRSLIIDETIESATPTLIDLENEKHDNDDNILSKKVPDNVSNVLASESKEKSATGKVVLSGTESQPTQVQEVKIPHHKVRSTESDPTIQMPNFRMAQVAQVGVRHTEQSQQKKIIVSGRNPDSWYEDEKPRLEIEEDLIDNLSLFTPGNIVRSRIVAKERQLKTRKSKEQLSGGLTEDEKRALEKAFAEKELQKKQEEDTKKEKSRQNQLKREEEDRLKNEKIAKSRRKKSFIRKPQQGSDQAAKAHSETLRQHLKNVIGVNFNQVPLQDGFNVDFDDELLPHPRSHSSDSSSEDEVLESSPKGTSFILISAAKMYSS